MNFFKQYYRCYISTISSLPSIETLAKNDSVIFSIYSRIQLFYFALLLILLDSSSFWYSYAPRSGFIPIPIIFWTKYFSQSALIEISTGIILLGALLGCMYYSRLIGRMGAMIALIVYQSIRISLYGDTHQSYPFLYTAFFFLFLPPLIPKLLKPPEVRKKIVFLFFAVQIMFMLLYTMSGIQKILQAIIQTSHGEVSILHPFGMSMLLADWKLYTLNEPMYMHYLISTPILGWLGMIAVTYLEVFSLLIVFRPQLHKLWAIGLLLFHISTIFTMNVMFYPFMLLLIILFLDSPFAPKQTTVKDMIMSLPLIGFLFNYSIKLLKRISYHKEQQIYRNRT